MLFAGACKNEPGTVIETSADDIDSTYCNCQELVFNEPYNHFYLTDKRTGFTGKCEEFHPNGQVKVQKNFVSGKLHGKLTTWYENGQVKEEKEFDTNFQVGEQINYTSKGEVKFHAIYKRGVQTKILVSRSDLPDEDEWSAQ